MESLRVAVDKRKVSGMGAGKTAAEAIDEKLSNAGFLRIQKSFLVNLAHVSEIFTELIVMSDGSKLPISRGKTREVRSVYMNWLQNKDIIMSDM